MTDLTLRERVENWLEDMGLGYEPLEEPQQQDQLYEWMLAVSGQGFGVTVAQKRVEGREQLWMQVLVRVSEDHQAAFRALESTSRRIFLLDLRLALLLHPVAHWLIAEHDDPLPDDVPTGVGVGINLLEDPIKVSGFMRRNFQLQNAATMAALTFQKLAAQREWP